MHDATRRARAIIELRTVLLAVEILHPEVWPKLLRGHGG